MASELTIKSEYEAGTSVIDLCVKYQLPYQTVNRITQSCTLISRPKARGIRISGLMQIAQDMTPYTFGEIIGDGRTRPVVRIRQAIMYLGYRAGFSLPHIGRVMRRDHTTVLHGFRQASYLIEHDPHFRRFVQSLAAKAGWTDMVAKIAAIPAIAA